MNISQIKIIILVASIFYGIYIRRVITQDLDSIKEKLDERYFQRALFEYAMLTTVLGIIFYAFLTEKSITRKRTYLGLISLSLASAVTSFSSYVKLLTLPAFTVIFFWAITHSFI